MERRGVGRRGRGQMRFVCLLFVCFSHSHPSVTSPPLRTQVTEAEKRKEERRR
jgi:hypothetical protein